MDIFWEELVFGLPDTRALMRIIIRLLASTLLGAVIGYQRQRVGKPAGTRTHILVSLGTTVFVLACAEAGMSLDGLSRVIQGIVTGIGFVGAGSILKLSEERDIQGLTTAAGIWMTAAVGVAMGLGMLGVALLSTFLTLIILALVGSWEYQLEKGQGAKAEERNKKAGRE
jgi:putative Mg2+ transporter-C (MgtC) family protein